MRDIRAWNRLLPVLNRIFRRRKCGKQGAQVVESMAQVVYWRRFFPLIAVVLGIAGTALALLHVRPLYANDDALAWADLPVMVACLGVLAVVYLVACAIGSWYSQHYVGVIGGLMDRHRRIRRILKKAGTRSRRISGLLEEIPSCSM